MRKASSTGTALAERMLQRAREARGVEAARQLADQRQAQLQAVKAPPVGRIAQPAREQKTPSTMRDEQLEPIGAEEVAGGDQHAGDERQLSRARSRTPSTTFGTTYTSRPETMPKHMMVSTIG